MTKKTVTRIPPRATRRRQQREDKKPKQAPLPKGRPVLRILIINWQMDHYNDEGKLVGRSEAPDNKAIAIPESDFPPGIEDWMRSKGFIK